MIFETWLTNAAPGLGITAVQLATMLSFIFIGALDATVAIATGGRDGGTGIIAISTVGVLLFSFMGWIPAWTGAILALLGTIMFVDTIRKRL